MNIYFENEAEYDLGFDYENILSEVINKALESENFPFSYEVNLSFVNNEEIHEINKETRGIDRPTDVLSFPMIDFSAPADYSILDDSSYLAGCINPDTNDIILGDILISVEKAMEQAEEYGHPLKREICFLTAHSILHLLGYDHETDEERLVMEKKQEDILESLGITR
ncbi:MAG: rRNA maturation RNase YbeY [Lachnospiraceae bacterium]|nr:rRNA maturation RNase YbeY [Lachnospiraceae bacterium]